MNTISVFQFQTNQSVRVEFVNNEPYFCLKDVAEILEIKDTKSKNFNLQSKGVEKIPHLTNGGKQELTFINEPNLYRVIFRSNKPEAVKFQDWIFEEVIPQIRKTGSYSGSLKPDFHLTAQTTPDERTPLRDAVFAFAAQYGLAYSTAYKMVHQRFNVEAIEAIPAEQIPLAVEYVHRLTLNGEVLDAPDTSAITFSQRELRELATVAYYCAWANNLLSELAAPLSDLGYAKASTLRTLPNESRFFLRNVHKALMREMPKIASAFERECMQNSLMRCELFI